MGLGLGTYWTARLTWADHLSRSVELSARRNAVRIFPSATLYERLAEKLEESGGDPIPDLERAVALEPENAAWRIRLGLRAELAGDYDLAERNLLKAADLSRLYQPRYLLAQYYFRRQNADHFQEWARAAFATAYGDIAPLLDLCWRLRPDAEWLGRQAPSGRPEIAGQFLLFLARRHQTGAARALAVTLAGEARREDLPALLEYCTRCLDDGNAAAAVDIWNALCARRLLPDGALDPQRGESLTNAGFEHAPADAAFDWRLERAPWLRFAPFPGGMRVTFSGNQPESCLVASQYVPVVPGTRYRLRLVSPPPGEPSAEALDWRVYDSSGRPVAIEPSADRSRTFTAPTEVVRLHLIYQRPIGSMRLEGTVAIGGARLERER